MRKQAFDRGRWQVYRERCHLRELTPPSASSGVIPVGNVLAGIMKTLDGPVPPWFRDITEEWTSLAGATEAKHARPGRYEDGTLIVFVDGAVWLNELKRYWRVEMLRKLQDRFGIKTIAKLVLQPDPDLRETERGR